MSNSDLTAITGVGDSTADELLSAGFETVRDVATADFEALEDVSGLGETSAREVAYNALDLVADDNHTSSDNTDSTLPVVVDDDDAEIAVSVDIADEAVFFVQEALFAEFLTQHTRRKQEYKEDAVLCADALHTAIDAHGDVEIGGTTVRTYEFILSERALTTFYRAISTASSRYAERRGISHMYGQLDHIAEQLTEYR